MINLPRKLVYTDRTRLSDFMEENELNREIGFVLEGILRFQCNYFSPTPDGFIENNMLSIFNNAYYLSILAANDTEALDFFQNCDKYGSAFHGVQVALIILSLQEEKNEQMKKILGHFECLLNPLLMQVIHKYRAKGQTFSLDFSPCPPPVSQLTVDWEKVTAMFNPEKVVKIISLWKTKDERKKVLHRIWGAAGILQDGASYSEACAYLRILDNALDDGDGSLVNVARYYANEISRLNKEIAALKEEKASMAKAMEHDTHWVRKVVDYAKDCEDWKEAKPYHDMLNEVLRESEDKDVFQMVGEIKQHFRQKRKKEMSIEKTETFINQAGNVYLLDKDNQPARKQLG